MSKNVKTDAADDISILHRQYEVTGYAHELCNIVEASIGLPPEMKARLGELKLGEEIRAPSGYTVIRKR